LASKVAVCEARATVIEPVADHFPVWEYSSEEVRALPASSVPPVTSTSPVGSNVAVCKERAEAIGPVPDHTGVLVWAARGATVIDPRRPTNSRLKDVIRLVVRLPLIPSPSKSAPRATGQMLP
jgi:hypothetical protein